MCRSISGYISWLLSAYGVRSANCESLAVVRSLIHETLTLYDTVISSTFLFFHGGSIVRSIVIAFCHCKQPILPRPCGGCWKEPLWLAVIRRSPNLPYNSRDTFARENSARQRRPGNCETLGTIIIGARALSASNAWH